MGGSEIFQMCQIVRNRPTLIGSITKAIMSCRTRALLGSARTDGEKLVRDDSEKPTAKRDASATGMMGGLIVGALSGALLWALIVLLFSAIF